MTHRVLLYSPSKALTYALGCALEDLPQTVQWDRVEDLLRAGMTLYILRPTLVVVDSAGGVREARSLADLVRHNRTLGCPAVLELDSSLNPNDPAPHVARVLAALKE